MSSRLRVDCEISPSLRLPLTWAASPSSSLAHAWAKTRRHARAELRDERHPQALNTIKSNTLRDTMSSKPSRKLCNQFILKQRAKEEAGADSTPLRRLQQEMEQHKFPARRLNSVRLYRCFFYCAPPPSRYVDTLCINTLPVVQHTNRCTRTYIYTPFRLPFPLRTTEPTQSAFHWTLISSSDRPHFNAAPLLLSIL